MNENKSPLEGFTLFDNSAMTRIVDKITLTSSGQFNFPAAFYNLNKLKDKKCVRVYYNQIDQKVAITFLDNEDPKGFKLILSNNGKYGGYIAAKSFITLNKIDLKKYGGRYDYEKIDTNEGLYFVINLGSKDAPEDLKM